MNNGNFSQAMLFIARSNNFKAEGAWWRAKRPHPLNLNSHPFAALHPAI
jgi:hypothetical protein